jgi:hypothetical protein
MSKPQPLEKEQLVDFVTSGSKKRKPDGFWKNPWNVEQYAVKYMERTGRTVLPGEKILKREGESGFVNGVYTHYPGRIRKLRENLGQENKVKLAGDWTLERIEFETLEYILEFNYDRIPPDQVMRSDGRGDLAAAIYECKYPGGVRGLRQNFGQENPEQEKGFWNVPENIEARARDYLAETGRTILPSQDTMVKDGWGALAKGVNKYPGTIHGLRKKFGQDNPERERGFWDNPENTRTVAKEYMIEFDCDALPGTRAIADNGWHDFVNGINKYRGKIQQLREDLGQKNKTVKNGHWKPETMLDVACDYVREQEYPTLPTVNKAKEDAKEGLVSKGFVGSAPGRYPGGWNGLRADVELKSGVPTKDKQLEELVGAYLG